MRKVCLVFWLTLVGASFAQAATNWHTDPLGPAQITTSDGFDIKGAGGAQTGLYFVANPDPAQRSRLVVNGELLNGAATLRLRIDGQEPTYLKAPTGKGEFNIGKAQRVEVLIYSDKPFEYRVRSIELEACASCKSTQEIVDEAADFAPGWMAETYQQVDVSKALDALTISSTNPPGGLYFRKQLDASKTYRLSINGESTQGSSTVRTVMGSKPAVYAPAPNGSATETVSGANTLEVLIYGDAPFAYRLKGLSIEECPTCRNDGK